MLLAIVVFLMFVLVTMNVGNLSLEATKVANAADSAALLLGSQLATRAHQLIDGFLAGDDCSWWQCCVNYGWLDVIFAVIIAIIVIVVSWGTASPWVVGLFAALGGMVGASIQGTSVAQGAITGFSIGYSLGSLAGGIRAGFTTAPAAEMAPTVPGFSSTPQLYAGVPQTASFQMGAVQWGGVLFGAAGVTSTVLNSQNNMPGKFISDLNKQLNSLDELSRYRESAILTAMSQVVDDPRLCQDIYDVDLDQDFGEYVSCFESAYRQRILALQGHAEGIHQQVVNFLNRAKCFVSGGCEGFQVGMFPAYAGRQIGLLDPQRAVGILEKKNYQMTLAEDGSETAVDNSGSFGTGFLGRRTNVWYFLNAISHSSPSYQDHVDAELWSPGPTAADRADFLRSLSGNTPTPDQPPNPLPAGLQGYDRTLDLVPDDFRKNIALIDVLTDTGWGDYLRHLLTYARNPGDVDSAWRDKKKFEHKLKTLTYDAVTTWFTWATLFYNVEDRQAGCGEGGSETCPTMFFTLGRDRDALIELRQAMNEIKNDFPRCYLGGCHTDDAANGGKLNHEGEMYRYCLNAGNPDCDGADAWMASWTATGVGLSPCGGVDYPNCPTDGVNDDWPPCRINDPNKPHCISTPGDDLCAWCSWRCACDEDHQENVDVGSGPDSCQPCRYDSGFFPPGLAAGYDQPAGPFVDPFEHLIDAGNTVTNENGNLATRRLRGEDRSSGTWNGADGTVLAPVLWSSSPGDATVDDLVDDWTPAGGGNRRVGDWQAMDLELGELIRDMELFRQYIHEFWDFVNKTWGWGYAYEWTDRRGHFNVQVSVARFALPGTETHKSGHWYAGEECMNLTNYDSDSVLGFDGTANGTLRGGAGPAVVTVTKTMPSGSTPMGILGQWLGLGTITKSGTARWGAEGIVDPATGEPTGEVKGHVELVAAS